MYVIIYTVREIMPISSPPRRILFMEGSFIMFDNINENKFIVGSKAILCVGGTSDMFERIESKLGIKPYPCLIEQCSMIYHLTVVKVTPKTVVLSDDYGNTFRKKIRYLGGTVYVCIKEMSDYVLLPGSFLPEKSVEKVETSPSDELLESVEDAPSSEPAVETVEKSVEKVEISPSDEPVESVDDAPSNEPTVETVEKSVEKFETPPSYKPLDASSVFTADSPMYSYYPMVDRWSLTFSQFKHLLYNTRWCSFAYDICVNAGMGYASMYDMIAFNYAPRFKCGILSDWLYECKTAFQCFMDGRGFNCDLVNYNNMLPEEDLTLNEDELPF